MNPIVELTEEGGIYLPSEILESIKPHTRFVVEMQHGALILRPEPADPALPFWATATPEEQAESFLRWAESHTDGVGLPDEALRRENMYD